ncbi:MAG: arginine repressor [Christensenellaceae bacterium]|jgi:transcriptional regulator of arginine metabolism|nr:arginine repressor [Christensenellaceae bacterium]
MARSVRQSKILDIISVNEIETQEELVAHLRAANFDITQATISRDIKELGLIKILSQDSNRYKYALVDSEQQQASNKFLLLFKESVISVKTAQNLVVIKTLKGVADAIINIIDKFNIENTLGSVSGDDTVMIIFETNASAKEACDKIHNILTE